jgi:hypothetical protein
MMGPRDASRERGGAGTQALEGPQLGKRGLLKVKKGWAESTLGWAGLLSL